MSEQELSHLNSDIFHNEIGGTDVQHHIRCLSSVPLNLEEILRQIEASEEV